ncbi:MAG: hypothetical protein FWG73_06505 [Planctomycetaceae bacterium]|nr:hypothetical protein [Planctomycetaceae bacterium]
MHIFISNGLRGKENPIEYVEKCRAAVARKYPDGTRIDSYFKDFNGSRIEFLGKSIECLSQADLAVFMDDWHNYDGCVVEHMVCQKYGIPIDYISTKE